MWSIESGVLSKVWSVESGVLSIKGARLDRSYNTHNSSLITPLNHHPSKLKTQFMAYCGDLLSCGKKHTQKRFRGGCSYLLCYSLLLVVFFSQTLFAQTSNERLSFLGNNLIDTFNTLNLPPSAPIYITLNHHQRDEINKVAIQEVLLKNNKTLVEDESFAEYTIQIIVEESFTPKKSNTFPIRTELYRDTAFTTQIVRMSDKQLLNIKRFNHLEKHNSETQNQSKWYSPYLIITVIGTLVYLIFYGI